MAKSILICDDAAFMRMMIKDILTKNGYNVVGEAENGLKAVEKYTELKPDLVLMDIDMPEMDGIETAKRIMEMTDHTVPILFVTALCDRQTVTLCRNLDAAGYIVRPYKPVFVKTEIKRILMGRSEIE